MSRGSFFPPKGCLHVPVVSLLQLIRMPPGQAQRSRSKRDMKSLRRCQSHHRRAVTTSFKRCWSWKCESNGRFTSKGWERMTSRVCRIPKRDGEVKVTCQFSKRSALNNSRWHGTLLYHAAPFPHPLFTLNFSHVLSYVIALEPDKKPVEVFLSAFFLWLRIQTWECLSVQVLIILLLQETAWLGNALPDPLYSPG